MPNPPVCPGPCNNRGRKAWGAYEAAVAAWPEVEAGYHRAYEYWQARVAEVGAEDAGREPVAPQLPAEPDVEVILGDPVWCRRDAAMIRAALTETGELASRLEAWADGHRGATSGERTSTRRSEAPSPSPIADTLLVLYGALRSVEDGWRRANGHSPRRNRARNSDARERTIAYLLTHLDRILAHPQSAPFGHAVLGWEWRLQQATTSEPVRRRRPGRCVRCGERALRTRDDGYTECAKCGRWYHEDQYQEEVVDAQADEPIDTKAQAS